MRNSISYCFTCFLFTVTISNLVFSQDSLIPENSKKGIIEFEMAEDIDPDSIQVTIDVWGNDHDSPENFEEMTINLPRRNKIELPVLEQDIHFFKLRLDQKSRDQRLWIHPPAVKIKSGEYYTVKVYPPFEPEKKESELTSALATHQWKEAFYLAQKIKADDFESSFQITLGALAGFKEVCTEESKEAWNNSRKQLFYHWLKTPTETINTARLVGLHSFYIQGEPVLYDLKPLLLAVRDIRKQEPNNWKAWLAESSLLYRMENFNGSSFAAEKILKIPEVPPIARANALHRLSAIMWIQQFDYDYREQAELAHKQASYPLIKSGLIHSFGGRPNLSPFDQMEALVIMCESVSKDSIILSMLSERKELVNILREKEKQLEEFRNFKSE